MEETRTKDESKKNIKVKPECKSQKVKGTNDTSGGAGVG